MTKDKLPPGDLALAMVPLMPTPYRGAYRYAIYMTGPGADGISPLWGPYTPPETSDRARKALAPKAWPGMVYFPKPADAPDVLPAWHFALDFSPAGWGTDDGARAFANAMAKHTSRRVSITILHGWNSRAHVGEC